MIQWVKGQKPAIKYTIIFAPIALILIIILIIVIVVVTSSPKGTDVGAYLEVPDSSGLQYRLGNDAGLYSNGWDDSKSAILGSMAGYDGWRKKMPENHFESWGYGIEVGDCQTNQKYGILDVVGFLATPTAAHSSNSNDAEYYRQLNLYEKIWDGDEVNQNNYWAYYCTIHLRGREKSICFCIQLSVAHGDLSGYFCTKFTKCYAMAKYKDTILTKFADNVRHKRYALGISQEELAFRAGVHRTYIGMVERTERNISLVYAEKIAKALNTTINELIK